MDPRLQELEARLHAAERSLARMRRGAIVGAALGAVVLSLGFAQSAGEQELRVRRLTVVDEDGRSRIELGQDPKDTQRNSRMVGLVLRDRHGAERCGLGTNEDDAVSMGFDAPHGVGAPMPDRLGMGVEADGSAHVMLIDNRTLVPVRLSAEADGDGGLDFIGYDFEKKEATVKRLNFKGETSKVMPLGG